MAIEYRPGFRLSVVQGRLEATGFIVPQPPRPPRHDEIGVEVEVRPDLDGVARATLRFAAVAGSPPAQALRSRLAAVIERLDNAPAGAPLDLAMALGDVLGSGDNG